MRKSRSFAAFHIFLAVYQLSSKTWVWVPATGSNAAMIVFINSILLWNDTFSCSQTALFRYICGANGQRCPISTRSEEHTSELQSREKLVCRLLLEKRNYKRK